VDPERTAFDVDVLDGDLSHVGRKVNSFPVVCWRPPRRTQTITPFGPIHERIDSQCDTSTSC
jgi:hypothetical protein